MQCNGKLFFQELEPTKQLKPQESAYSIAKQIAINPVVSQGPKIQQLQQTKSGIYCELLHLINQLRSEN